MRFWSPVQQQQHCLAAVATTPSTLQSDKLHDDGSLLLLRLLAALTRQHRSQKPQQQALPAEMPTHSLTNHRFTPPETKVLFSDHRVQTLSA